MHELENQRHTCSNLEKKQRQFDKQLQEERLIATTRAEERDQSQARERAAEAKVLSATATILKTTCYFSDSSFHFDFRSFLYHVKLKN